MRVCFVGNMLGKNVGFVTTQGQIVAELLAADGYEITCISSQINRAMRVAEIVTTLITNRRIFDTVVLEVYSGLSFLIVDVASLVCSLFKLPLVMVLHGGNLPKFIEKHPLWAKTVFNRAAFWIAPSCFLAEKLGKYGFEIRVIPNVVDLDRYLFRERVQIKPRLIWMRSFHSIYNPQMAVEVLDELRKTHPSATLVMAGKDKGLESDIVSLAKEKNLFGPIRFAGFLDEKKKNDEFSAADIYINTNRVDNMPVSVLEARAFGLPVVATNVGGLPFLISDGENGLLCESDNAAAMAAAIVKLLDNPELAGKLSRGGRLLAERSAWETVKKEWESLFSEIVEKRFES